MSNVTVSTKIANPSDPSDEQFHKIYWKEREWIGNFYPVTNEVLMLAGKWDAPRNPVYASDSDILEAIRAQFGGREGLTVTRYGIDFT